MGENRVFLFAVDTKNICTGVTYAAISSPSITIQKRDLRKSGGSESRKRDTHNYEFKSSILCQIAAL
jgi:hypothetical protein